MCGGGLPTWVSPSQIAAAAASNISTDTPTFTVAKTTDEEDLQRIQHFCCVCLADLQDIRYLQQVHRQSYMQDIHCRQLDRMCAVVSIFRESLAHKASHDRPSSNLSAMRGILVCVAPRGYLELSLKAATATGSLFTQRRLHSQRCCQPFDAQGSKCRHVNQ